MLAIAHFRPLAIGHQRAVYQHPIHPELLIKVMRPESVARRWNARGRWLKRLPRARHYSGYLRELKEYIAAHARAENPDPPIARAIGLVETDLGLGLVCEKVCGANGEMAPTLYQLWANHRGEPPWAQAALDTFLHELLRHNIIVGDLNAANLVYGHDSRGGPRLLMVDGFGEKSVIPLSSMSRLFNRHFTLRRYRRMVRNLTRPVSSWQPVRIDP